MKLSERITQVKPSATLTITSKAKAMKKEGVDVISFGAGEPDFDTPQYIKDAAISAMEKGKTKYTPSIGTVELREVICRNFTFEFVGWDYDPRSRTYEACFRFDQILMPEEYFYQESTHGIYWISIAAGTDTGVWPEHPWGWKSRPRVFGDDAVLIFEPVQPSVKI